MQHYQEIGLDAIVSSSTVLHLEPGNTCVEQPEHLTGGGCQERPSQYQSTYSMLYLGWDRRSLRHSGSILMFVLSCDSDILLS
jgi:hypothetical protein